MRSSLSYIDFATVFVFDFVDNALYCVFLFHDGLTHIFFHDLCAFITRMNAHLLQGVEARAECQELMAVHLQMLNPQNNKPSMGLVQDALTASLLCTRKDTFLHREEMMNLMMSMVHANACRPLDQQWQLPPPAIYKPEKLWTGKQLYSLMLPYINLSKHVRDAEDDVGPMDVHERYVLIREGQLVCGTLCKQTLGSASGGIVHITAKDLNKRRACDFLTDAQKVMNRWFCNQGFSVGISDCVVPLKTTQGVKEILHRAYDTIDRLYNYVDETPGMTRNDVEPRVLTMVSDVIHKTGRLTQGHMDYSNRVFCMATAGSKGTPINISQTTACVGQQSLNGARIRAPKGMRTLPRYTMGEDSAPSRGLVENSYITGLTPAEFFLHAMGGREGLVDTAVKTSYTGYIQRRLLKAMEAMQVQQDGTIRNAEGYIVDFAYGADGIDAQYLESYTLSFVLYDNAEMFEHFQIRPDDCQPHWAAGWEAVNRRELKALFRLRARCRQDSYSPLDRIFTHKILIPVHISRALQNVRCQLSPDSPWVEPTTLFSQVEELLARIRKTVRGRHDILHYEAAIRTTLCSKQVCVKSRWSVIQLEAVISLLERGYVKSLVEPYDMVGALAAESIGEPSTQLTLNTFHLAGVGCSSVTMGVPRLREVIDVSKSMKTPTDMVFLRPPYHQSREGAETLAHTLSLTLLGDVVKISATVHQNDLIPEDEEMIRISKLFQDPLHAARCSQWIIRLVLNKNALLNRGYIPATVARAVKQYIGVYGEVCYSETNNTQWVLRISLYDLHDMVQKVWDTEETQSANERTAAYSMMIQLLKNIPLGGIAGIKEVTVREVTTTTVNPMTQALVKQKEWVIDTSGTALQALWFLDAVDWTRTVSNDLNEIYELLGVEAALQVLYTEITRILSFGTYVNPRHIAMLCNTMVFRGYLMPMSRHGINHIDTGVTQRASFEESMEMIMNAAAFGEYDPLLGVTENVMVGEPVPMGTGHVTLVTTAEYKKRAAESKYGEPISKAKKARILRSNITEWDTTVMAVDNLDHVERPPSPEYEPVVPVDLFVPESHPVVPAFAPRIPPYTMNSTTPSVSRKRKYYQPESPVLHQEDQQFTRLTPHFYYPESPVITSTTVPDVPTVPTVPMVISTVPDVSTSVTSFLPAPPSSNSSLLDTGSVSDLLRYLSVNSPEKK